MNKKVLVILNGWGSYQKIWDAFLNELRLRYEIKFIDTCSYILSTDFTAISNKIATLIPDNSYLLGWSLGGQIALKIAAEYADKVTKLITIATNPKFIATEDWLGMELTVFDKFYNFFTKDPGRALKRFSKLQLMGEQNLNNLIAQITPKKFLFNNLKYGLDILRKIDLRNLLKKITMPNLHIYGTLDYLVPVKISSVIKTMPAESFSVIIDNTNHMPFFTQKNECLNIVDGFINE